MGESENPRRICIRFKDPAGSETAPILKACKSLKRKITAAGDTGIQTSSAAKRVARSANMPDLSNKNSTLSSNSLPRRSEKQEIEETRPLSMNSLPDGVLVEILCRLPYCKFVFQCKSVSKRWHTLITNPYFISRFVTIQSYKKTPEIRTLINKYAEEFPLNVSPSPKIPPFLERMKSFHRLGRDPFVVAAYRDLVVCSTTKFYQQDYYICNAYTMESVALPPPPSHHEWVQVGLICDSPYRNCKNDDWEGHNIELNADYRCKVVRILLTDGAKCESYKVKVEIFSSETGEWKESVVSIPVSSGSLDLLSFAYNGRLYWSGPGLILIGLDPFNDNNGSSNDDGIFDHKPRLTVFEKPMDEGVAEFYYQGVCGGCVRMCHFRRHTLHVCELKEEDGDEMVDGDVGKLCLSKRSIYSLDPKMLPAWQWRRSLLGFDPNNEDILYLGAGGGDFIKCNIRTRKWSKIVEKCPDSYGFYFRIVLPWWPTPVPRLQPPQHARN